VFGVFEGTHPHQVGQGQSFFQQMVTSSSCFKTVEHCQSAISTIPLTTLQVALDVVSTRLCRPNDKNRGVCSLIMTEGSFCCHKKQVGGNAIIHVINLFLDPSGCQNCPKLSP